MTAKNLFTIILKIFGIYLIKDIIIAIPVVLGYFIRGFVSTYGEIVFGFILSVLSLSFYVGIVYMLLFKTSYLISKLKLTADLSEEVMPLKVHRSTVYTIAIIISGIFILAFALPNLVMQVYAWLQFLDERNLTFPQLTFDFTKMIAAFAEVMVGLLFLGNQRLIVNFIELKSRKGGSNEQGTMNKEQ